MSLPRPIAVSDEQLSAIMRACAPLQPMERSALLAALAHRLRGYRNGDVGDGELHRLLREILREVWRPPKVNTHAGMPVHRPVRGPAIE
jgi:hypothetical protein